MPKDTFFSKVRGLVIDKLLKIDDSAHKIALGAGLGVFSGFMPGTGPVAALFLAFVFRANRAAALLGSILTNLWLSLITFILAVKIGSLVLNRSWQDIYQKAVAVLSDFHLKDLFALSFLDIILPVVTGYLIIGAILGLITYAAVLFTARIFLRKG